jgi:LacI family transcriptional regulator
MASTLKDVAQHAGVSTATVSRVLNGDPRITEATRTRVLKCVRQLDYTVNTIARSLKTARTFTIGLVTPEIANDFFMKVAQAVEVRIREDGYNLMICNSNESIAEERHRVELLLGKCVDGLILIPAGPDGTHLRSLSERNVPVVLADRLLQGFQTDAVLVDNASGTRQAIDYLVDAGRDRFGFIGGDLRITTAKERYAGFCEAITAKGLTVHSDHYKFGDFHTETGYALMGELLSEENPPDTVFISNYYMHVGATQYLVRHRDLVPPGFLVASFDDMELSRVVGYAGLTIAQPVTEIGSRAAELLLERMRGRKPTSPRIERLRTRLVHHHVSAR